MSQPEAQSEAPNLPEPARVTAEMPMPGNEAQIELIDAVSRSKSLYELYLRLPRLADDLENNQVLKDNEFDIVNTVRSLRRDASWPMCELLHSMSPKVIKSIIQGTVAYDSHPKQSEGRSLINSDFPCFETPVKGRDPPIPGVYVIALYRQFTGHRGEFLNIAEMKMLIEDMEEYVKGYRVHAKLRADIRAGIRRSESDLSPDDQLAVRLVRGVDFYAAHKPSTMSNTAPPLFIKDDGDAAEIEALVRTYRAMCRPDLDPTEQVRMKQSPLVKGINKPLGLTISIFRRQRVPVELAVKVVLRTWQSDQLPMAEQLIMTLAGSLVYQRGFNATEGGGTGYKTVGSGESLKTNMEYVMSRVGFIRDNFGNTVNELEARKRFLDALVEIDDELTEIIETMTHCKRQLESLPSMNWDERVRELRELLATLKQDLDDRREASKFWKLILEIQRIGVDAMGESITLSTRYRSSVDGIAKKLHALELDQVGEVYFEFLCDEAVWMKTYHHRSKFGLAPEWPFKEKPGRHDLSLGPSVHYRQWRLDNGLPVPSETVAEAEAPGRRTGVAHEKYEAQMRRIQTAALSATDEVQRLSPVILLDEPLVLIPDFRANKAMPWIKPFPSMDTRKAIWEDLLDFNRLVLSEDRAVYNEVERLVSPILTIAWRIVFGKPVSLIVGVDPKFDNFSASPFVRLEVRRLWQYVCHWVLFATKGHRTTLSDHIALLLAKEKLGLPMGMGDLEGLASAHFEAINNLADSERNARVQHEAEEQLTPELHAILQQPLPVAREYLGIWVRLDMPNADMRLNFALKYWIRFAVRSGKGVEDMLTWRATLSKELEEETQRGSE
ncbi:hypothetical protein F25303_6279 [Fusarium sp. NRRL 25303]|nr:hypothetical protein F25303_6279 [Fusarium sp. NRRL 25303]